MAHTKTASAAAVLDKPYGRQLTCLQCGHQWRTVTVGYDPQMCPQCHGRWNIPRDMVPRRIRIKKAKR